MLTNIHNIKQALFYPQVGCVTICCPWKIGRISVRTVGPDARSTITALLYLAAPSLSPAATSTQR